MNNFRKFLIFLRQQKNTNLKMFTLATLGVLTAFIAIGVLTDIYLPWNYFINTVRCIFLLVIGLAMFSLVYVYMPENKDYKILKLREALSFKQRLNLSLLIWFIVIVLDLILVKSGSPTYTVSGSVVCAISLGLITFIRPTYDETKKFENNVTDERDIIKERKEKE